MAATDSNLGATFNQSVQFELLLCALFPSPFWMCIDVDAQRIIMLEIWNCIRIINNNCYYLLEMLPLSEAGSILMMMMVMAVVIVVAGVDFVCAVCVAKGKRISLLHSARFE